MAEPPIGIPTPPTSNPPTTIKSIHADIILIVLDGGTGFLKVGYAAQVCPFPISMSPGWPTH